MGAADKIMTQGLDQTQFDQWFDQRFETKMTEREEAHVSSLAIIATKGTLDWAYPPFILASTASALGWDVSVFFTFYGLELLKKDLKLEISPLGNPGMPMKMPLRPAVAQGHQLESPQYRDGRRARLRESGDRLDAANRQEQRCREHRGTAQRVHRGRCQTGGLPDDGGTVRLFARRFHPRNPGLDRRSVFPAGGAEVGRVSVYLTTCPDRADASARSGQHHYRSAFFSRAAIFDGRSNCSDRIT